MAEQAWTEVVHDGSTSTVAVHGEVDVSSAGVVQVAVDEARQAGCSDVVVDLAGVTFMDLSGLRVLHAAATDGISLVVRNPTRLVRRVIDLAGMAELLPVEGPDGMG